MAIARLCKLFYFQFEGIGIVVRIGGLNFIGG
jgi:hypothetical protein